MNSFKIRYSQFDTADLAGRLSEIYDLPSPVRCQFFKNGLNDMYKITAGQDVYFLRVSMSIVHNLAEIEDEIAVILRCREKNLDVVEPIVCRDGRYVWEFAAPEGIRQVAMFRGIKNQPSDNAEARFRNLGAILAGIHEAALPLSGTLHRQEIDKTVLSKRPLSLLKPYLGHRMGDYDFMKRTNLQLLDFIAKILPKEKPYYGICHGDFQPGNYFFDCVKPVVFDFDCLGGGYLAYDLGVLLANLSFSDNDIYKKPVWGWILEGYDSVRRLTDEERKAIFAFAALHIMRVLAYHMEIVEQNNGIFYFTTDPHLNLFIGAYRRLYNVACAECGLG